MLPFLLAARPPVHDVAIHSSGTNSASWALVIFCVVLGLIAALTPQHRTTEIKGSKD
jgi:hypothetical protein